MRSPVRGSTRLTLALAQRAHGLQLAPVDIAGTRPLFVDLRDVSNHPFYRDSPHADCPIEHAEVAVLRHFVRPGDVAYDVGTNRGFLLVQLAALVGDTGRVVGFEPNPVLLPALRRTVAATPWATLVEAGLSDASGHADLYVGSNHEKGSVGDWVRDLHAEPTRPISITLRRLDELIAEGLPRPDVVKVDVEGNELRVFRGAREALDREDAPVVLFESNVYAAPHATGEPANAATQFLAAECPRARFRFYFVWSWGLVTPAEPGSLVHGNLVALPAARAARWPELDTHDFIELLRDTPSAARHAEA
ncbi:MAG: FkbM family methyltransferase [Gemmatimonadaceae bacterium]